MLYLCFTSISYFSNRPLNQNLARHSTIITFNNSPQRFPLHFVRADVFLIILLSGRSLAAGLLGQRPCSFIAATSAACGSLSLALADKVCLKPRLADLRGAKLGLSLQ